MSAAAPEGQNWPDAALAERSAHGLPRVVWAGPDRPPVMPQGLSVALSYVDALERPDALRALQVACQSERAHAGAVMAALTPDGALVHAQRADAARVADFAVRWSEAWRDDAPACVAAAEALSASVARREACAVEASVPTRRSALALALRRSGFGEAFRDAADVLPRTLRLGPWRLVAAIGAEARDQELIDQLSARVAVLLRSGVHDLLGGGVFEGSDDPVGARPRFARSLARDAELLLLLASLGAQDTAHGEAFHEAALRLVEGWERSWRLPCGRFGAAWTAGSETAGWTPGELDAALGADSRALRRAWGVHREGPLSGGRCALRQQQAIDRLARAWRVPVSEALERRERAVEKLRATRDARDEGAFDARPLTEWNALAARALVEAAEVFREPAWVRLAERVLEGIASEALGPDACVYRVRVGGPSGSSGDAPMLARACAGLYRATGAQRWSDLGVAALEAALWPCTGAGALYARDEGFGVRASASLALDGAAPSPALSFSLALAEWAALRGEAEWAARARALDAAFASRRRRAPLRAANYVRGSDVRAGRE